MVDIVNLNKVRKSRAKTKKSESAAENRSRFGQPKSQRQHDTQQKAREKRDLDGKKRETPEEVSE